jgi:uncharacterized repeat protein (TIGR02543 family)
VPANLTLFSALSPAFSNPGFLFSSWNTQADGLGTSYSDGAIYPFSSDLELFAQWTAPFHPVTFLENDSPSDNVSTFQTVNVPTHLTLFSALSPAFSNPGFLFSSWNTQADGLGTSYSDGAIYSFSSAMGLYAQWVASSTSVNFVSNGGSGSVTSLTGSMGSSVLLPGQSALSYPNHTFAGWNTLANGSGTAYSAGATFVLNGSVTLYAQWTASGTTSPPAGTTYVITINEGSGSGTVSPITLVDGSSVLLPSSAGLSNPGYTFAGWYSAQTGGVLLGLPGATFVPTSSIVIYAQWTPNAIVTLRFSSNRAKGIIKPISGLVGTTITMPSTSSLTYPGFTFAGWNTTSVASGISYAKNSTVVLTKSMTLFAQWSLNQIGKSQSLLLGAVGPFASGSSSLSSSLKSQVRRIAQSMRTANYASATLYGYATGNGTQLVNMALSSKRALSVVVYLRSELRSMHVKSVTMRSAGEGAIMGLTSAMFRRVEIFVK